MLEHYCYVGTKKLRMGISTGSCAAAAAKAAAHLLLFKEKMGTVSLLVPKGIRIELSPAFLEEGEDFACCGVTKDAGDDIDVTDGILVCARISYMSRAQWEGRIKICGGEGVGKVTKPGLDQPVGEAAINTVPRKMIEEAVREEMEACSYMGNLMVEISIPKGRELAVKTFNPRLGIEGGLSVLGTSGMVEPMSRQALVDTIHAQMRMQAAAGKKHFLVTPGNYGMEFMKSELAIDITDAVKCGNFVGETIDMAYEFEAQSMLIVGHAGKLVKLAAGVMNTHSHVADCRMEALAAAGIRCGLPILLLKKIVECTTTDEAMTLLQKEGVLQQVMEKLIEKIEEHVRYRACEGLKIGVVLFSNVLGMLGQTREVEEMMQWYIL